MNTNILRFVRVCNKAVCIFVMELSPTADIYLLNPSHPETTMCWNPREDMSAFKDLLETKLGSLISTNVTFSCVLYKPNEPQAVTLECTFAAIFRLVSLIFIRQFKAIFIALDYRRKQLWCSTNFFFSVTRKPRLRKAIFSL